MTDREYRYDTFIFFQRVLTEIDEAKTEADKYVAKSNEAQFDKNAEENKKLFKQISKQIEQMQTDIRIFTEDCQKTAMCINMHSGGQLNMEQSKDFLYYTLCGHMSELFQKVHGIEDYNPQFDTNKRNVADKKQDATSTTMAKQYRKVTGFYPPPVGQNRLPGGQNRLPGGQNSLPGGQNRLPGGQNSLPGGQNRLPGG